ncbi:hypothetical protein HUJ04_005024 [Dendroctonus ponderosae]|nr:hypothetical protein HUJ04_005024 [Dendroctonus ponderosae]
MYRDILCRIEMFPKICKLFIANELRVKFNVTHDEANSISSSFLSNFRKCPENTLMSLDKWRTYLWSQALGDKYQQYASALLIFVLLCSSWLTSTSYYLYTYISKEEERKKNSQLSNS